MTDDPRTLNNLPSSNEIWRGIGGHFDSLGQIIAEFVDNAVANITATASPTRSVSLYLEEREHTVFVRIEDTGTGIRDLDNAFTLGGKAAQEGPLNEHGFGMKHALASANPDNGSWSVSTRTAEDFENGVYQRIAAPYVIHNLPVSEIRVADTGWPGQFNGPGTVIEFECSREMFNTLRAGRGPAGFVLCVEYLKEDLGFTYAGLIEQNEAAFTVAYRTLSGETDMSAVPAVKPDWDQYYGPGRGTEHYDLGNGPVELRYEFGAMKVSSHRKYYKRNMSTSGLEVRLNGRVIAYNLFRTVWNLERHNMYNHVLVIVDIRSDDLRRLPPTRTSKNGFRQGDARLEALYEWVRRRMPTPPRDIGQAYHEADLFDEVENHKRLHIPEPKVVTREQDVFTRLGEKVRVDLYVAFGSEVWLYEGKKDSTTVKDVYQLRMYWDGAVEDGLHPTKGILLASEHPASVNRMVQQINGTNDLNGNPYVFEMKTWRDEGVAYP